MGKKLASLLFLFTVLGHAQQFKAIVFTEAHIYHHNSVPAGVKALKGLSEKHFF